MGIRVESSESEQTIQLVHEIEKLRLRRKRERRQQRGEKHFSQDELCSATYPSYKNMLLGRTQRLPDRAALMIIADYLECSPIERNNLLRIAQYAPTQLPYLQWRKQITTLVGNIFVPLSPTLDVEDASNYIWSVGERLENIIGIHGGIISERTGNTILALWSVEKTQEDDPEQAIRAALMMQTELKLLDADARFGIHTGQALLQTIGQPGQIQASGEVVNIASRLSYLSAERGILISHSTYSHLRNIFDMVPMETIRSPVRTFQVTGTKRDSEAVVLQKLTMIDTPMVGRTDKLAFLKEAFDNVHRNRQEQIIMIVGEAGIGKSRLLYEFDRCLQQDSSDVLSLKGRATKSSQETPYYLLRNLLNFCFEITDGDFSEVARQKIEYGIASVTNDAELALKASYIISHLLSFNFSDNPYIRDITSDAQEFFENAVKHLLNYFRTMAIDKTIVLILEDNHWADESSLIMLRRLFAMLSHSPVLVLCTVRPDHSLALENLRNDELRYKTLELGPLSQQERYSLVAELLIDSESVPESLRQLIANNSGGNPLYIEELVKLLVENGTLFRYAEKWLLNDEQLTNAQIPGTLIGLLQARFDSLSASQQLVLQVASVFGRVFWDGSVKSLLSNAFNSQLNFQLSDVIDELCEQKLIFRQKKSMFRGYTEYRFKHALLCDVIYATLVKTNRQSYHSAATNWLLTVATRNHRLDENAGLIAYHFKCADLNTEACNWYQRAGKAAAARFANSEALAYLTCALTLLPSTQEATQYAILSNRERVNDALGLREEQAADLGLMSNLAYKLENVYLQIETLVRQTNYAYLMGHFEKVTQLAENAINLSRTIGAKECEASSYVMLGNVLWNKGDYYNADRCFDHALALVDGSTSVL